MKKLFLSLVTMALASTATAVTDNVIDVVPGDRMTQLVTNASESSPLKYTIPSMPNLSPVSASSPSKANAKLAKLKVSIVVPSDNYIFSGMVYFYNEEFSGAASMPLDEENPYTSVEGTLQIPEGTYDVCVQWTMMNPAASAAYIIKEQVTFPDVTELIFDPAEATCRLNSDFRNPEDERLAPSVMDEDGNILVEGVSSHFDSSIWLSPSNGTKFLINGFWLMGFGAEILPEYFYNAGNCYVNPLSDRYIAFNAHSAIDGDRYFAGAEVIYSVSESYTFSAQGQPWEKLNETQFSPSIANKEQPLEDERLIPSLYYYLYRTTFAGAGLGGNISSIYTSLPPEPLYDLVVFGVLPSGNTIFVDVDYGDGMVDTQQVWMTSQPFVRIGDRINIYDITNNFEMQDENFVSSEAIFSPDSPFNVDLDNTDLILGNTAPVICLNNKQFEFDNLINKYYIQDFGRLGEDRSNVDQIMTTNLLKIDNKTVVTSYESLDAWSYSHDASAFSNSTFDLTVRDNNVLIDDYLEGYTMARSVTDWSTGDRNAPVVQRLLTRKADGFATDRFDKFADGRMFISGGDFKSTFNPDYYNCWFTPEPAPAIEVMYSPRGADNWNSLPVSEIEDAAVLSGLHVWEASTADITRGSVDGWFDLAFILTDAAGNFCHEIISPAFYVAEAKDIENVDSLKNSATMVFGAHGAIVVAGIEGSRVEVFNISGRCIADTSASHIPVDSGIYIVRINGSETFKVIVP